MLVKPAKRQRQEARGVGECGYYILEQSSRTSQYTDICYLDIEEGGRKAEHAGGTGSESLSVL
jgi:hypothetical protein